MKNNYNEAKEYLKTAAKYGSIMGLDTIKELLRRLDNPQDKLEFVHVAGTNGKGSTVMFISTILQETGIKVGCFCSPDVFEYREIIQINGEMISKESMSEIIFEIKSVIDAMLLEGLPHPTIFELETAAAFLYFYREKCDIVVLEAGLGGALDATNIVKNTVCAVLSPISRDHMEFLGNTLYEIAVNKAGIIKEKSIVVAASQENIVLTAIKEKCSEHYNELINADYKNAYNISYDNFKTIFSYKEFENAEIVLFGTYQLQNAVTAIEAAKALNKKGYEISREHIISGLRKTEFRGRFEVISREPLIIIDGAHNEAAALALKETILTYLKNKSLVFIIGMFVDKEYDKVAKITAGLADNIITVETPDNARALGAEELLKTVKKYNKNSICAGSIDEALELAKSYNKDAIIAFGSLSYLKYIKF